MYPLHFAVWFCIYTHVQLRNFSFRTNHQRVKNRNVVMISLCIDNFFVLKGWVVQPSFLDDPEHHTLIHWARERLLEAIRKR